MIASMPMKVCWKPEPGIVTNGRVEAGGDRLGEHRLAGAGRAEEEQPAFALAAGLLERLAGLPERDDAADFFLGLVLAADVRELTPQSASPGSKPRICDDPDQHHRAEEDQEVEEEEDREAEDQADVLPHVRLHSGPDRR